MKKGIISIFLGMIVGFIFFWTDIGGIMGFLTAFIVSSVLGYLLISSLLMSDKDSSEFEKKIGDWFEEK